MENNVERPMVWKTETVTIREFVNDWIPNIDLNPIHQRVNVENIPRETSRSRKPSKRQEIAEAILRNIDIGEITINTRTPEERARYTHIMESIDGGHRKRTISEFVANKFPLSAKSPWGFKKFGQLPQEIQEKFYNFQIRLLIFIELLPHQKADVFQTRNKTTPVNEQERLNGFGDLPVANFVRETARYIGDDIANNPHQIFETYQDKNGKLLGKHINGDPSRLTYDRIVARMLCVVLKGKEKPSACDDLELEDLYRDRTITQADITAVAGKVGKVLDFCFNVRNAKKAALTNKGNIKIKMDELITFWRLYYIYKERWGDYGKGYKIENWEKFYLKFIKSWVQFDKKNPSKYGLEFLTGNRKTMTRLAAFNKNHSQFSGVDHWRENIEWLEKNHFRPDALIADGIITVLDKKRTLTTNERIVALARDDFQDPIDPSIRLTLDNSHAGHMVAHSKGGKSTLDNIKMMHADFNLEQGTEDGSTFIERKKRELKAQKSN